jgi:hypothetical protein
MRIDIAAPTQLARPVDAVLPRPRDEEAHLGEGEEPLDLGGVGEGRVRQAVLRRQLGPRRLRRGLGRPLG